MVVSGMRKMWNAVTHERLSADPALVFYALLSSRHQWSSMNASVSYACPPSRWVLVEVCSVQWDTSHLCLNVCGVFKF